MSAINHSRSWVIKLIFASMFLIVAIRLFILQIVSSKYQSQAEGNAIIKKVIYPPRGLVFDYKKKIILTNTLNYDLMITPAQFKGADTVLLCQLLESDTVELRQRILQIIKRNPANKPSVLEAALNVQKYARLQENLWRFSNYGIYIQDRPVREYPYNAASNVLGYISEVDSNFLKNHKEEGYQSGDYAGKTGIEKYYEKTLMGQRGIQYLLRDKTGQIKGSYQNNTLDKTPVSGKNLYSSIDIELQKLGEKLMQNKLGSIVAINPKTGGIICMVSSPTYNPNYISGSTRRKHLLELSVDPRKPFINRAVNAMYSPGSTFKTLQALIGLHDEVITTHTNFYCSGAFYGCGTRKPMKCLDPGTFHLKTAITYSCNTYFANVMQRVITNPKFPNIDSSLRSWDNYMYSFGLGKKLGVDVPSEKSGYIPTPEFFNSPKRYGPGKWNFCNFRSVSIGQGEVLVTPLQAANEMAYLANKGWYYTPHLIDSIEGGDKENILQPFKVRHKTFQMPDSIFEAVHDGMQNVVEQGTGQGAKVKNITICGKTGTVENYQHVNGQLKRLANHSFFCAFAPRENPKIAIMCVVENSGKMGGTYAAPIAGLMIEKFLNDSIANNRKSVEEHMTKLNLIPQDILELLKAKDSLEIHKKDSLLAIKIKPEEKMEEDTDDETDTTSQNIILPVLPDQDSPIQKKPEIIKDILLPNLKKQKDTLIADSLNHG